MDMSYRAYSLFSNAAVDGFKLYGLYLMCTGEVGKGLFAIGSSLTLDVVVATGLPRKIEDRNCYDRVKFRIFD